MIGTTSFSKKKKLLQLADQANRREVMQRRCAAVAKVRELPEIFFLSYLYKWAVWAT
jgi:cytochrome oxidase assembly protein ShyY1